MNTMYKETVEAKRSPVIFGSFAFIAVMISLSNILYDIRIFEHRIGVVTTPLIFLVTVCILASEFSKCHGKYKYSIIAGELMVYKVQNSQQSIVKNVKLNDIVFVGKRSDFNKKISMFSSKNCSCSLICFNKTACIFKENGQYKRIYLDSSEKLSNKLKKISENNISVQASEEKIG